MAAYIVNALPDQITKAVGNSIVHSLWQGLILASIAGLIIVFTRRSPSAVRYNLLIAALALFGVSSVYTAVHCLTSGNIALPVNHQGFYGLPFIKFSGSGAHGMPFNDTLAGYLDKYSNMIVSVWLLVVCIRSLQLMTGLYGLHQFRRKSVMSVSAIWEARIHELASKLGIRQMIRIAESGIAKCPMVIGSLKPLILLPAGLLTTLPPEEIEAILIHELAHIRRRDYLVNMIQTFMEIIFFFNPAVLWISSLIKAERENCCDDIAIAQTSSKADYIRALVSCQEYQLYTPLYAMAFKGSNNHLLLRVKRIMSGRTGNQSLNVREKSALAICLIATGIFIAAFSNTGKINKVVSSATTTVTEITEVAENSIATANKQTTAPSIKTLQHQHPAVETAGYPSSEMEHNEPIITIDRNKMRQDYLEADAAELDRLQTQLDAVTKQLAADRAVAVKDSIRHSYELGKLTEELINEGIIRKQYGTLSFKLSTKEFIVNGIKQPDNVFTRFRDEYIKVKGPNEWAWYYNYETSLETVTII